MPFPGLVGYLQRGLFGSADVDRAEQAYAERERERHQRAQENGLDRDLKREIERNEIELKKDLQNNDIDAAIQKMQLASELNQAQEVLQHGLGLDRDKNQSELMRQAEIERENRSIARPAKENEAFLGAVEGQSKNSNFPASPLSSVAAKNRLSSTRDANDLVTANRLSQIQPEYSDKVAQLMLLRGGNDLENEGLRRTTIGNSRLDAGITHDVLDNPYNRSALGVNRLFDLGKGTSLHEDSAVAYPGLGYLTGPSKFTTQTAEGNKTTIVPPGRTIEPNPLALKEIDDKRKIKAKLRTPKQDEARRQMLEEQRVLRETNAPKSTDVFIPSF